MSKHDTREFIVECAQRAIAEVSLADALSVLSPQGLADASRDLIESESRLGVRPLTASNVAYHWPIDGTPRQFDREGLLATLLDRVCAQVVELRQTSARRYLQAADALKERSGAQPVHEAIAADMAKHRPGAHDATDDARNRLYLAAVAWCDADSEIARKLRGVDAITDAAAATVYEEFLELTGRQIVDGYSVRELALLISMLLRGEEARYRYASTLPMEKLSGAIMRMFWAFTVPLDTPTTDIEAELLSNIRTP